MQQDKFMQAVEELKNIAAIQENKLTKGEIHTYLEDMQLEPEQYEAIYQYLGANHIQVEGYVYQPEPERVEALQEEEMARQEALQQEPKEDRAARNRRLYKQEVANLKSCKQIDDEEIERFLQGEEALRETIVEGYLEYVLQVANTYKKRMVPAEELIAEGNLGLLEGIQRIWEQRQQFIKEPGVVECQAFRKKLESCVKQAMESLIDAELENKDQESSMLAKTNLLHEATKYMAEEMGRIPTVSELAEYTKISEKEVMQWMGLSEDTKGMAAVEEVAPLFGEDVKEDMMKAIFQRRGKRQ